MFLKLSKPARIKVQCTEHWQSVSGFVLDHDCWDQNAMQSAMYVFFTALLCECKAILSNDLIVPGRLIDWSQTMLLKVKSSYRSTGIQIREWFLHYSLQWDHIVWTIIPWIGEHYSDNNHYTVSFYCSLSRNKIGDEGCATLSRGLKECRELKGLS